MEMSSSSLGAAAGDDSLHGLMFGKKIYFEDGVGGSGLSGNSSNTSKVPPPAALAAPAAPQRKGRAVVQSGQQQPPRCQVEGCEADLSGVKAYYCRHKVCGMHSKAPKVVVGGMEQRFCQQCSRFHQLTEFDQGKRSCRRRLAGHNERRRKPPPGPFTSRYSQFAPAFHEPSRFRTFLMDFGYPKLSTTTRDIWPAVRPAEQVAGNQWHGVAADTPSSVHGAAHPYLQSSPGRILYPSPELPPGDCVAGASDASCALSLLSTQPWANDTTRSQVPSIPASSRFNAATPMAHPFISNNYMADAWGRSIPHQTRHEIGTSRADEARGERFSSELELALQANGQCLENALGREYDHHHSGHMIHWSLRGSDL